MDMDSYEYCLRSRSSCLVEEYRIAERQLAMKDSSEKSWFNYIRKILNKYNMPSVYSLFEHEIPKSEWKTLLNQ